MASPLEAIKQRVSEALQRAKRAPDACQLMVVSKTWPADRVGEIAALGNRCFGENKVQEGEGKIPTLNAQHENLDWHLIGHLQRNKVRKALPLFNTLHGVDSLKLARHISNVAADLSLKPNLYLQVNIAGEESKSGYQPEILSEQIGELLDLPSINIKGLMCIPPAGPTPESARPWFAALRELRDALETSHGTTLPGLSMGMSSDFEVAIEEGSTIVRVGSAIFGKRNYS